MGTWCPPLARSSSLTGWLAVSLNALVVGLHIITLGRDHGLARQAVVVVTDSLRQCLPTPIY